MLLRQIFTFLLMTAFALQTFSQYIIAAEYRINTAAFAKNCINKAKPILKCKGKCQMMKKMQEEQKEKETAQKKGVETNTSISSKSFFCTTVIIIPSMLKNQFPQISYSATSAHLQEIFHPPSC